MMENNTNKAYFKEPIWPIVGGIWGLLVRPHPSIHDREMQRKSRLLASLTLAVAVTVVLGISFLATLNPSLLDDLDTLLLFFGAFILLVAYIINRSGFYRPAGILTVAASTAVTTFAPFLPESAVHLLAIAVVPVLLAAFIYSPNASVLVASISISSSALLTAFMPNIDRFPYLVMLLCITVIDAIILLLMYHQRVLECERRRALAQANAELRASEAQLEWRVLQHTYELEKARAEAAQANHIKSQFLASVGHELRTPLNAIINFSQFVTAGLYGPVNHKQTEALEKSTGSARHLLGVINNVLNMSRIEAGRFDLRIEDGVRLQDELNVIYEMVCALVGDRPIEVLQEVEADLPTIIVDHQRIRQVLMNLATNAVRYTEAGYICLRGWREGEQVVMAVEDTGSGIALEDQASIFKPFWQLKRNGGSAVGTGLGLSISQWLVEAHGGRLWLESEVGSGSVFYISLPVRTRKLGGLKENGNEEV